MLVPALRDAGLRIILSNMLTISENFGLVFLSFCQQSSISWCSTTGQSMGAGSLKSCSMAFITWNTPEQRSREKVHLIKLEQRSEYVYRYVLLVYLNCLDVQEKSHSVNYF